MELYTGETLKEKCLEMTAGFDCRDISDFLHALMIDKRERRTIALYGLRRTGKTVMMMQEILRLNDFDRTLFVSIDEEKEDSIQDLRDALAEHPDMRYYVLDEVTYLRDFIAGAAFLANKYSAAGHKVLMTGTNSLGFALAKEDSLYGRIFFVPTTYISYEEFHRLVKIPIYNEKTQLREYRSAIFQDYLKYGGTLTDGHDLYEPHTNHLERYTNTAIVKNLSHAMDYLNETDQLGVLDELYSEKEFSTYVNRLLEVHRNNFFRSAVSRAFKPHDIDWSRNVLIRRGVNSNGTLVNPKTLEYLQSKEFFADIREAMKIKDHIRSEPSQESMDALENYLEEMGVIQLVPLKRLRITRGEVTTGSSMEYLFSQPGMRYCQEEQILLAMQHPKRDIERLQKILSDNIDLIPLIQQGIESKMLEDIVDYNLSRHPKISRHYEVYKFQAEQHTVDDSGHEFDTVLTHKKTRHTILLEEKHSTEKVPEYQGSHLLNKALCQKFMETYHTPIVGKAVVYCGENSVDEPTGLVFCNVGDFLCHIESSLQYIEEAYAVKDTIHALVMEMSSAKGTSTEVASHWIQAVETHSEQAFIDFLADTFQHEENTPALINFLHQIENAQETGFHVPEAVIQSAIHAWNDTAKPSLSAEQLPALQHDTTKAVLPDGNSKKLVDIVTIYPITDQWCFFQVKTTPNLIVSSRKIPVLSSQEDASVLATYGMTASSIKQNQHALP